MAKQLIKIGNSLGITIPSSEVERLGLKPGDQVDVLSDGQALKIVPVKKIKAVKLGGLWKGIDITEEDIVEARREMWGEMYR